MKYAFVRTALVLCAAALSLAAAPSTQPAKPASDNARDAQRLADAVVHASGIEALPKITHLRFTFNVSRDGKTLVSAAHDWDMPNHTDTVTWNAKTVTVNIKNPGDSPDQKAAFQRWTNDSYWLLAPLKLKDPGVILTSLGKKELDGETYDVLHLQFENVGLTSHDQYDFYIDPKTSLPARWTYMPTENKHVTGTWEDYKVVGGLKLATNHQFGGSRVFFTNLSAETR